VSYENAPRAVAQKYLPTPEHKHGKWQLNTYSERNVSAYFYEAKGHSQRI